MLHKMLIFKRGIGFSSSRRRNQVHPGAKVEQGIPCSNPAPTFGIDANLELIPQLETTPWNRFQVSKFFKNSPSVCHGISCCYLKSFLAHFSTVAIPSYPYSLMYSSYVIWLIRIFSHITKIEYSMYSYIL